MKFHIFCKSYLTLSVNMFTLNEYTFYNHFSSKKYLFSSNSISHCVQINAILLAHVFFNHNLLVRQVISKVEDHHKYRRVSERTDLQQLLNTLFEI